MPLAAARAMPRSTSAGQRYAGSLGIDGVARPRRRCGGPVEMQLDRVHSQVPVDRKGSPPPGSARGPQMAFSAAAARSPTGPHTTQASSARVERNHRIRMVLRAGLAEAATQGEAQQPAQQEARLGRYPRCASVPETVPAIRGHQPDWLTSGFPEDDLPDAPSADPGGPARRVLSARAAGSAT